MNWRVREREREAGRWFRILMGVVRNELSMERREKGAEAAQAGREKAAHGGERHRKCANGTLCYASSVLRISDAYYYKNYRYNYVILFLLCVTYVVYT